MGWQQRAATAEADVHSLSTAKAALQSELLDIRQERNGVMSHAAALEQRILSLEHASAVASARERELEGRHLELEAQLA